jgi:serine/threonine protein phosphatase PrpC
VIGPPQDNDDVLQLFSLLLDRADTQVRAGKRFGIPFAAFLKLGNSNRPSSDDLIQLCRSASSGNFNGFDKNWPVVFRNPNSAGVSGSTVVSALNQTAMFADLLQFALDSAPTFNLQGPQVCRLLAAVGQTLEARKGQFRQRNRSMADRYRSAAHQRVAPAPAATAPESAPVPRAAEQPSQIVVTEKFPWQIDFRAKEEQAACFNLDGITLWHASYIGPRSAEKMENQDATFALTAPEMSSPPYLVFALADGVTTSLGSRLAATSIVRRFCKLLLQQMNKAERLAGGDLINAAQKTQVKLEELARTLLQDVDSHGFEAMLGSELTRKVATRVLQNTLEPRVAAMPAALNATLIGGVAQPNGSSGNFQVDLLRIGDGSVEHINAQGEITSVLDTDPEAMKISEALGPGPQSRSLFDEASTPLRVTTVTLGPGETLLVSSDGLQRGHTLPISRKLSELLGEEFWKKAQAEEADAALQILHRACNSADELFLQDAKQSLFADNVSLILIRSEGGPHEQNASASGSAGSAGIQYPVQ